MGQFRSVLQESGAFLGFGFNVTRSANEKLGGLTIACYEDEFNSCLDKLEVWDHPAVGCFYTWTNRQCEEEFVA